MAGSWYLASCLLVALVGTLAVNNVLATEAQFRARPSIWTFARLAALNSTVVLIYRIWIYPYVLSPLRSIPSPQGSYIPLLNFVQQFREPFGTCYLEWVQTIPNSGLIRFMALWSERLLVTSPVALRQLLVLKIYDFEKDVMMRDVMRFVLGDGLIVAEGDEHKFLRKGVTPAFSFRRIRQLYPIFWGKSMRLAARLMQEVKAASTQTPDHALTADVEMSRWIARVTIDVIGVAALGKDFRALDDGDDPIVADYEELLRPTAEKLLYVWLCSIFSGRLVRSLPWHLNNTLVTKSSRLRDNCSKLMKEKKARLERGHREDSDVLAGLLEADIYTDKQIVDQLLTFLPAGHETMSSSFSWACYLLATHPEIQAELRAEIVEHVPCIDSETIPDDLDLGPLLESLPLLNGVCSETIRLYPTPPSGTRTSVRPVTLAGYKIPVGTEVIVSQWAINRSVELWGPDAERFVPSRWIDKDGETDVERPNGSGGASSNYSMMSFGHGPRNCIGQGFARAELRCLVAVLVSAFEIKMTRPDEVVMPFTVIATKPKNGLLLSLTPLREG